LVPANKPFWKDQYIPAGDLRDHKSQVRRADVLIFSGFNSEQHSREMLTGYLPHNLSSFTSSTFELDLVPTSERTTQHTKDIILVTGIAKSQRVVKALPADKNLIKHFSYRDHYSFSSSDIKEWIEYSKRNDVSIVTTEKDWMRLKKHTELLERTWVLPIDVEVSDISMLIEKLHQRLGTAKKG
ncbi:MAG: tetraacyldisaccharide 4'-kinase, partial [Flavobacteriales bacterium]|nr:tetraacyldisaccharide 4'-kinase [Flavobacteriales bacterium]